MELLVALLVAQPVVVKELVPDPEPVALQVAGDVPVLQGVAVPEAEPVLEPLELGDALNVELPVALLVAQPVAVNEPVLVADFTLSVAALDHVAAPELVLLAVTKPLMEPVPDDVLLLVSDDAIEAVAVPDAISGADCVAVPVAHAEAFAVTVNTDGVPLALALRVSIEDALLVGESEGLPVPEGVKVTVAVLEGDGVELLEGRPDAV